MKFKWIARNNSECAATELHCDPLVSKCLKARGFSAPEEVSAFLSPKLKNLRDPFEIAGIEAAVTRLLQARQSKERVAIFGDYDVDGVSATAILVKGLGKLGWTVIPYLPHRVEEGYGLSEAGVSRCLDEHAPSLLVAVDCGTSSADVVDGLNAKGVDVVILDHHQRGKSLPKAVALVNPHLEENGLIELCAAGLAFKLLHAMVKRLRDQNDSVAGDFDVREYLQFVALATIADIVPLTGENRILVSCGLERLNKTTNPGLLALKQVAQIQGEISTYHVGYLLAPRLNAAGRLDEAMLALQLLLTDSASEALEIAQQLNETNTERQQTELQIFNEALKIIETNYNSEKDYVIIQGDPGWHIGVIGIVASRLQQRFYRPVILAGGGETEWRGSGRSIQGFNLAAGLQHCTDLLVKHGGHAMAAGITIDPGNLGAFREKLNELAKGQITAEQLQPGLTYDLQVTLSELSLASIQQLMQFEPFGPGNPGLHFRVRNVRLKSPPVNFGKEGKHLRILITDGTATCQAIWWNCPGLSNDASKCWDIIVQPEINTYNGSSNVRLKILDCREVTPSLRSAEALPEAHLDSSAEKCQPISH